MSELRYMSISDGSTCSARLVRIAAGDFGQTLRTVHFWQVRKAISNPRVGLQAGTLHFISHPGTWSPEGQRSAEIQKQLGETRQRSIDKMTTPTAATPTPRNGSRPQPQVTRNAEREGVMANEGTATLLGVEPSNDPSRRKACQEGTRTRQLCKPPTLSPEVRVPRTSDLVGNFVWQDAANQIV